VDPTFKTKIKTTVPAEQETLLRDLITIQVVYSEASAPSSQAFYLKQHTEFLPRDLSKADRFGI
jgi:hypothetical protein